MAIREITLEEVLQSREDRADIQQRLIRRHRKPMLSCTMNIPGPVKQTPLVDFVFRQALKDLRETFHEEILAEELRFLATGPEAFFTVDAPADSVKKRAVALEEGSPAGRLLDLDVLDTDGQKLSRPVSRTCLICGGPVSVCSRSRAHGLEAVAGAAWQIMKDFAAERLSQMAGEALTREALLTPKPGLVDGNNSGAHRDMDLAMLLRSAACLGPYFRFCASIGLHGDPNLDELIRAGLEAEKTMLGETGGVNTHKGAIYAMGLFLCAVGAYFMRGGDPFEISAGLAETQSLASAKDSNSHGQVVLQKYKAGGAREEAMRGFPTARKGALALAKSGGEEQSAFLEILAEIRDTNLLYRGGPEALAYVQGSAQKILAMEASKRKDALLEMDQECIRLNISPGGAADMLALALLIDRSVPECV